MPAPLYTHPFINSLVRMDASTEALAGLIDCRPGTVRGVVVSVDDPDNNGRVKVVFDDFNPDCPQVINAGDWSKRREGEEPPHSHWIDVVPAFKGRQPPGLVGKRVEVSLSNGQYQGAVLKDVLYDPDSLTEEAGNQLQIPNNSSMTRLPVYPAGKLPPACEENHGCSVIEEGGPMNSDWVCVCLKRDGNFIWVRHSDLAHGHAGGNDVTSQVDSAGNRPSPGQMPSTYDHVFVTSHQEMKKAQRTAYSTAPAGNPWGKAAAWSPPPMSVIEALDFEEGGLFSQDEAVAFTRKTGFTDGQIPGAFVNKDVPEIPSAVEAVPGSDFATKAVETAKKALTLAALAQQVIADPVGFLIKTAEQTLQAYIPAATQFAISSIQNVNASIPNVFSSLAQVFPKLL